MYIYTNYNPDIFREAHGFPWVKNGFHGKCSNFEKFGGISCYNISGIICI